MYLENFDTILWKMICLQILAFNISSFFIMEIKKYLFDKKKKEIRLKYIILEQNHVI